MKFVLFITSLLGISYVYSTASKNYLKQCDETLNIFKEHNELVTKHYDIMKAQKTLMLNKYIVEANSTFSKLIEEEMKIKEKYENDIRIVHRKLRLLDQLDKLVADFSVI